MTKNTLKNTCNFPSPEVFLILFSAPTYILKVIFFFRSHMGQKPDGILICNSSAWSWEGSLLLA